MNFSDIKAEDPRWTEKERTVLEHLFRQRQMYINEHRKLEGHGVAKSIFIFGNVLDAFAQRKDRRATDSPPDPFQELK